MPTEKDAQPMHLTNYGPVIGYEYEPTVTRVEIQGFYTKLEIVDAVMPGMGLKDEKISGLGIELSQGVKLTDVGDLRVGGFLNYVYHFGLYSQDFVIPTQNGNYAFTLDIPRFHQLRVPAPGRVHREWRKSAHRVYRGRRRLLSRDGRIRFVRRQHRNPLLEGGARGHACAPFFVILGSGRYNE